MSGDGPEPTFAPLATHLETERLTLSPWTVDDAAELRLLISERGRAVPTVEKVRENIERGLEQTARNGIALLPIRRRAEGDLIGYCGLLIGRTSLAEPEIGYELFQRVHGHGYATEAARAVVAAAAATGRARLWATVGGWNAASLRVAEKLGFTRDHVGENEHGEVVWLTLALPAAGPRSR